MEQLTTRYEVSRGDGNNYHVDYFITNLGIEDVCFYGTDFNVQQGQTILQLINNYEPTARAQMFIQIDLVYPNSYFA